MKGAQHGAVARRFAYLGNGLVKGALRHVYKPLCAEILRRRAHIADYFRVFVRKRGVILVHIGDYHAVAATGKIIA